MKGGRVVSQKHFSTLLARHGALPKIYHGAPALRATSEWLRRTAQLLPRCERNQLIKRKFCIHADHREMLANSWSSSLLDFSCTEWGCQEDYFWATVLGTAS